MSTAWDPLGSNTTDANGGPLGPPPFPSGPAWPGGARPWSVGEMVAWAVILVLAGLAAALAVIEQQAAKSTPEAGASFTLISQYVVGVHELMTSSGTKMDLIGDLEKNAKSPGDRLRLAIVSGEIQGKDQAQRRLDAVAVDGDPELLADVETVRALYAGDDVPDATWQAFRNKYRWYAELAHSNGRAADDPDRRVAMRGAYWALGMLVGLTVGIIGLALTGLVLLIVGMVLWSKGRLQMAFRREEADAGAAVAGTRVADRRTYVQGLAWYLFGMLTFGVAVGFILRLWHVGLAIRGTMEIAALVVAFGLGVLWPLIMGQSWKQWRAALGLHRGRGVLREMGCGVLGYLAGLPVVAVGLIITSMLIKYTGITATHPINEVLTRNWGWILAAFVLASVWAPITEELMFRGALFAHLRERYGWWISAPVVGFIFAIIHPQGWVALPVLGSIGFVFCGIREWRGSIIGCMTAHALHNSMALVVAVLLLR